VTNTGGRVNALAASVRYLAIAQDSRMILFRFRPVHAKDVVNPRKPPVMIVPISDIIGISIHENLMALYRNDRVVFVYNLLDLTIQPLVILSPSNDSTSNPNNKLIKYAQCYAIQNIAIGPCAIVRVAIDGIIEATIVSSTPKKAADKSMKVLEHRLQELTLSSSSSSSSTSATSSKS
jgi:hypothetical protein